MLAIVSFCFLPKALEYFHEKAIHQTPNGLMEFLPLENHDQDTYDVVSDSVHKACPLC